MNAPLGRSLPPHVDRSPNPEQLHHAFERMNMGNRPPQLDHGIHLPDLDDFPPAYVGFTLAKRKRSGTGQLETWEQTRRTEMQLSEEELVQQIRSEKRKGISVEKKYLHVDFQGVKRDRVDSEIEFQNRLDPRFRYTLASLTTKEGRTPKGQRMTTSMNIILRREPARGRGRSFGPNEDLVDLAGAPLYPPFVESPRLSAHGQLAEDLSHQYPEPRLGQNQPQEPWVHVSPHPSPPPPPPPPPQPHHRPQPQPQPHPHTPHPGFNDSSQPFMDADHHRSAPPEFGRMSPADHVHMHPHPAQTGHAEFRPEREHQKKQKASPQPFVYDSFESASDDSEFSRAKTNRTQDTEWSDHGSHEHRKRPKQHERRKSDQGGISTSRDRSRDRRRENDYDHGRGLDRKDSTGRPYHRRDSEHHAHRAYRTHRRKSPARSPNSSRGSSSRYFTDDEYEVVPSRSHQRQYQSRRNSHEQRPGILHGRRFPSFSHPIAIHDEREEFKEEVEEKVEEKVKLIYTQMERDRFRNEAETLREQMKEKERFTREQNLRMMTEQEKARMRREPDRLDRWSYQDRQPILPELRYHTPHSQRFSRDLENNQFRY